MSSLVDEKKAGTLTRSDGTAAYRLSIRVRSEPEKMLLNPRDTTFDCTSPPSENEMPGAVLRWSSTERAARSWICTAGITVMLAGASLSFSGTRDTELTRTSSSWKA